MAGSSKEKGIAYSGDKRSLWASNVEHTLRIMREELDSNEHIELRILKVPEYDRQPTAEFSPGEWRFGLHSRDEDQIDMSESEAAKRAVVVLFGLDEQSRWISFCDAVIPDPKAMLKCYGLHKEVDDLLEGEIKQVLAFDALFLAVRIELSMSMDEIDRRLMNRERYLMSPQMWDYYFNTFSRCMNLMWLDLCKIENQIPFDLIKRAINHVQNPRKVDGDHAIMSIDAEAGQGPDSSLESWMKVAVEEGMQQFMDVSDCFYEGANANRTLSGSHHILDAAHKVICGVDGMERTSDFSQKDYIHVPSATRLKESGIRIAGVAAPLCGMRYDSKRSCLLLPKMQIHETTVSCVRNMARYEEYSGDNSCMFHDYVFLMLDLIQSPSDLNHLTKCDVIWTVNEKGAFDKWSALHEGLELGPSSKEHNRMKVNINNRCKLRRHRLWSEFKMLFLSRPWFTLSAIAVTLVTVATLVQTYVAVISSNQMKPQYKA